MLKKIKNIGLKPLIIVLVIILLLFLIFYKIFLTSAFKVKLKKTIFYVGEQYSNDFTATYNGKNVTKKVKVTQNIYSNAVGKYQIVFTYVTNNTKFTVTKTIEVKDNVDPVITLIGGTVTKLVTGDKYSEPGYSASDNYDGDLTGKVKVSGKVDNSKEGKYNITYSVTDSSGNKTYQKRTVIVSDETPVSSSLSDYNLKGYYPGTLLSETFDAQEEYVSYSIIIGDKLAEDYLNVKGLSSNNIWYDENFDINNFTKSIMNIAGSNSKMNIIDAIKKNQPSRILLTLSSNSIANYDAKDYADAYGILLKQIKVASPNSVIIVQSLLPVSSTVDDAKGNISNTKINAVNFYLLKVCSQNKVYFLNSEEVLKNDKGQLKEDYIVDNDIAKVGLETTINYFRQHAYTG